MRVLIVDDEPLFVEALEALLSADARIEVVGHASDGREAIELALRLEPDLVLMDLNMPVVDGFAATREIVAAAGRTRVLVLTGSESRADVARAREVGAAGYITKDRIGEALVDAILGSASPELP